MKFNLPLALLLVLLSLFACNEGTTGPNDDNNSAGSSSESNLGICSGSNIGNSSDSKISSQAESSSSQLELYVKYSGSKPNWAYLNPAISYGEFVDERDGQTYKTTKLTHKTWMAENLNLETVGGNADDGVGSICYQDSCEKYGRMYQWAAVMDLNSMYNDDFATITVTEPHQGLCPSGWHVPSANEFAKEFIALGFESPVHVFVELASSFGWEESEKFRGWEISEYFYGWEEYFESLESLESMLPTDKYGFSVMWAGDRVSYWVIDIDHYPEFGYYSGNVLNFYFGNYGGSGSGKNNYNYVRCVKDD